MLLMGDDVQGLTLIINKPGRGSKAELLYDRARCYVRLIPPSDQLALTDLDKVFTCSQHM
jgi:hypothetical protein